MIIRRTSHYNHDGPVFRWCKTNNEWCVQGEGGEERMTVEVSTVDGTTSWVVLGEEVEPYTYKVAGRPTHFRWSMWNGKWCVRGPPGHKGDFVEVYNKRQETSYVLLSMEVELGVYMFERC